MSNPRPPAVAGMFYPADARELAGNVDAMLAAASDPVGPPGDAPRQAATASRGLSGSRVPKALIVPHAGYVYSGPVAASAYARLGPGRNRIRTVVLLGPVHRVPVRGLALAGTEAFETPLGRIEVDAEAASRIRHLPQVVESPAAHRLEHSLEVHLPFLQRTLEDFRLVPLAVGQASREEVAQVLDLLWGGDETLIVVSSDLSHYLPYQQARTLDAETAAMIVDLRSDISHERACGGTPINGLTLAAHRRGLQVELVDLRNSGDTAGSKERVVGYAAFVVGARGAGAHDDVGKALIRIARHAIEEKLGGSALVPATAAWLERPAATFVTLTRQGALRGCIGSLEPKRALGSDVRENALGAAFRDPRFRPLDQGEWLDTRVEISLLSALERLPLQDEGAVVRSLRPGIDGLVLEFGHHRGTFLPQVWEQLPQPAAFLLHLKRKAGLPPDFWEPGMRLFRYTVTKWREQDLASDDAS